MVKEYTLDELKRDIFPNIIGHDKIKEAILMQYVLNKPFNVLVVGNPGVGKSEFIKAIKLLDSNNLKEISLNNNSSLITTENYCLIDKFHNFNCEINLNEFIIDKQIFAISNFVYGRYDPYGPVLKQLEDKTLFIKGEPFDLIFILKEDYDENTQKLVLTQIFKNYEDKNNSINEEVIKYLNSLKKLKITFPEEILNRIRKYYFESKSKFTLELAEGMSINGISFGDINYILKYTEAYTKLNNNNVVGKKELELAIELFEKCHANLMFEPNYDEENNNEKFSAEKLKEIKEKYPNAYKSWTEEEDKELINLFHQDKSIGEMMQIFQRQSGGIKARLKKLKLIE